jgi:hypothetical protein
LNPLSAKGGTVKNSESQPEAVYRLMETKVEARSAIVSVLSVAQREICIFDVDPKAMKDRDLGHRDQIETLRLFFLASRDHRMRIALHDTRGIEGELPRLVALLTQFSGQMHIHRTLGRASEARDSMVIADREHFWRKLHADHPRSVLTMYDPVGTRSILERFEEIWDQSELAVTGSSLGL